MERALVHSTTFSSNQLAMVAGLATLAAFDDEDIVERARRDGRAFESGLAPLVERYEMLHEVRGQGLMIGLEFGDPRVARRCGGAGTRIERMRTALFSQTIVVPLFHRHRILTQVAADNINVIKLLPPLIAGEEEVDFFVDALDDVLASAHKGSGLFFEDSDGPWQGARCRRHWDATSVAGIGARAAVAASRHPVFRQRFRRCRLIHQTLPHPWSRRCPLSRSNRRFRAPPDPAVPAAPVEPPFRGTSRPAVAAAPPDPVAPPPPPPLPIHLKLWILPSRRPEASR